MKHKNTVYVLLSVGVVVLLAMLILGGKATVASVVSCDEGLIIEHLIKAERPSMGLKEQAFWKSSIKDSATKAGVSSVLLASLVASESNFRGHLISPKGAKGVAQIMPFWLQEHKEYANVNLFEAEANLDLGAKILANYIDTCKGVHNGLRCYNGGPKGTTYQATKDYADRIIARAAVATVKVCAKEVKIADP